MAKFYSKLEPKQKFYLSTGEWLKFDVIDHSVGVAVIADERIQADIAKATRENRGGITEITSEEYLSLVSKKKETLTPRWREEFGRDKMANQTATPLPQSDAVAGLVAAGNKAERVIKAAEAAKPAAKRKA